jgi:hypothetical protein
MIAHSWTSSSSPAEASRARGPFFTGPRITAADATSLPTLSLEPPRPVIELAAGGTTTRTIGSRTRAPLLPVSPGRYRAHLEDPGHGCKHLPFALSPMLAGQHRQDSRSMCGPPWRRDAHAINRSRCRARRARSRRTYGGTSEQTGRTGAPQAARTNLRRSGVFLAFSCRWKETTDPPQLTAPSGRRYEAGSRRARSFRGGGRGALRAAARNTSRARRLTTTATGTAASRYAEALERCESGNQPAASHARISTRRVAALGASSSEQAVKG